MSLTLCEYELGVKYNQSVKRTLTTTVNKLKHRIKLPDLKNDCLKSIFEYLNFSDLLNVADVNDRLRAAACAVFTEKYQSHTFAINATQISIHGETSPCISTTMSPLETVGKFSKYFGQSIRKLALFGSPDAFYMQWVESCVSKYYTGTLNEILFYNYVHGEMMSELRKSFPLVESVTIIQSRLSANISQLNCWFPKMRSLKLIDNIAFDAKYIETHFPALETLVIWLHCRTKNGFDKSNICELIRVNPNIKELWLQFYSFPMTLEEHEIDQDLCHTIAVNAKQLERFVWAPQTNSMSNCDQIRFKSMKSFITESPVLQFSFKNLEELELRRIRAPINDIFEFVCRNKKLIKLKITLDMNAVRPAAVEQVKKMIKSLQKISEIIVDWRIFSADDLMNLLLGCKSLTKLQLLNVGDRMAQFTHQINQRNLEHSWKVMRTESAIAFKRKN